MEIFKSSVKHGTIEIRIKTRVVCHGTQYSDPCFRYFVMLKDIFLLDPVKRRISQSVSQTVNGMNNQHIIVVLSTCESSGLIFLYLFTPVLMELLKKIII